MRFLTARQSQDGRVIAEKLVKNCRVHPTHWLISTQARSPRGSTRRRRILAIGKERWVEKVEETRMIRKMAGLVALGMSLLTVFYAREISNSSAAASSGLGK